MDAGMIFEQEVGKETGDKETIVSLLVITTAALQDRLCRKSFFDFEAGRGETAVDFREAVEQPALPEALDGAAGLQKVRLVMGEAESRQLQAGGIQAGNEACKLLHVRFYSGPPGVTLG